MKNLGHENGGCVLTGRGCSCWRRVYTGGGVNTLQGAVQLDWMKYDHICFIRHAWDEIKKRSFCGDMPWVRFVPSLLLGSLLHSGLREAERGRRQSLADGEGRRWIQQTGWAGRQGGRGLPLHLLMIPPLPLAAPTVMTYRRWGQPVVHHCPQSVLQYV